MKRMMTRASFYSLGISALGVLMTGSLFPHVALAAQDGAKAAGAPEIYFYPTKGWTLDSKTGAAGNECVISNEFNNGFTVGLRGTAKWVQSVDIDFKQDAFELNKAYDVSLVIPGQQSAIVKGTAHSPRVLSLNLNGNKALYEKMRGASVFDFTVDENQFRFYMVGFANQAKDFERCMAGGVSKPQNTDIAIGEKPKTQEQNKTADKNSEIVVSATDKKTVASAPQTENEALLLETKELAAKNNPAVIAPVKPEAKQIANEQKPMVKDEHKKSAPDLSHLKPEIKEMKKAEVSQIPATPAQAPKDAGIIETDKNFSVDLATHVNEETGKPKQRLSDKIAAQIQENPEIAAVKKREPEKQALSPDAQQSMEIADNAEKKPDEKRGENKGTAPVTAMDETPSLPLPLPEKDIAMPSVVPVDNYIDLKAIANNEAPTMDDAEALNRKYLQQKKTTQSVQSVKPKVKTTTVKSDRVINMTDAVKVDSLKKEDQPKKPAPVVIDLSTAATPSSDADGIMVPLPHENVMTGDMAEDSFDALPPMRVTVHPRGEDLVEEVPPVLQGLPKRDVIESGRADRLRVLEERLALLEAENRALNRDLDLSLKESKQEQVGISDENWNLERAAKLYNESERQVKLLGQQLQAERAKHRMEVQELEAMLFDPQVTEQAQLVRLAELERQLAAARAKINQLEGQ